MSIGKLESMLQRLDAWCDEAFDVEARFAKFMQIEDLKSIKTIEIKELIQFCDVFFECRTDYKAYADSVEIYDKPQDMECCVLIAGHPIFGSKEQCPDAQFCFIRNGQCTQIEVGSMKELLLVCCEHLIKESPSKTALLEKLNNSDFRR